MSAITEIKERLDIVQTISAYLPLQRAGRGFKAVCPFHADKSPSLTVTPERQSWHCFGCGKGGDVLAFVMLKENLDFKEALGLLAQRAGVNLKPQDAPREREQSRLGEMNRLAAEFYHQQLQGKEGQEARQYVTGRGLNPQSISVFQLGYAPRQGEALKGHLAAQGFSPLEQTAGGLLGEREGRTYDRFRGRLIFPIKDRRGRALGFGGRALDDSQPKYLNSPETPLFHKGTILYGLERAAPAITAAGQAVLVEGYLDAITAHQHGYENVVATMGTAITPEQLGALKGLARSLVLALDPDAAGSEATLRAILVARQSLERQGQPGPNWMGASSQLKAEIKIVALPAGQDPDELIRQEPAAWPRLVAEALPYMDFILQSRATQVDLSQERGRLQLADEVLPLIAELGDEVERELALGKLARLVGASERALARRAAAREHSPGQRRRAPAPQAPRKERAHHDAEEHLLCLLLQHPELRWLGQGVEAGHLQNSENRELLRAWKDGQTGWEEGLPEALKEHLATLHCYPLPPMGEEQREAALRDCLRRLRERRLRQLKAQEHALLTEAEAGGRASELARDDYRDWEQRALPQLAINEALRQIEPGRPSEENLHGRG
ncbi:MAG: DNA primase [Chloroflexi bacterium]|nr:DNA primase [Chloroflexota bacterium]